MLVDEGVIGLKHHIAGADKRVVVSLAAISLLGAITRRADWRSSSADIHPVPLKLLISSTEQRNSLRNEAFCKQNERSRINLV